MGWGDTRTVLMTNVILNIHIIIIIIIIIVIPAAVRPWG